MDDFTFKLKSLEFNIKQKSIDYENCVAKAIKMFLETKSDIEVALVPCKGLENELKDVLKHYEKLNAK